MSAFRRRVRLALALLGSALLGSLHSACGEPSVTITVPFAVVYFSPHDGATQINPAADQRVCFNLPLAEEGLAEHLVVVDEHGDPVARLSVRVEGDCATLSHPPLDSNAPFRLLARTGLAASDGHTLLADAVSRFWTGNAEPCPSCPEAEMALWPLPPEAPSDYSIEPQVVTDQVTGLLWQRVPPPSKYTWEDAKDYCSTLSLAGRTCWRLPTQMELLSIVDSSRGVSIWDPTIGVAAINPSAFPDATADKFWSATPNLDHLTPSAWTVDFHVGDTDFFAPEELHRLRCVHSERCVSRQRYTIGVDTVKDELTGLIWQRGRPHESWGWLAAQEHCAALSLPGLESGWRVPTKKELESLVDRRKAPPEPPIDTVAFPDMPGVWTDYTWFWTSTDSEGNAFYEWIISFGDGDSLFEYWSLSLWVRCVHSGQ